MHAEVILCGLNKHHPLDQFTHPPFSGYMGITQSNTYSCYPHDTKMETTYMPPYKAVWHSSDSHISCHVAMPLAHLQHTFNTPFLAS